MGAKVFTLNCGSSSVKYQLYDWDARRPLARGIVERVTVGGSFILHEVPGRPALRYEHECPDHREAIRLIIQTLAHPKEGVIPDLSGIAAVGHRVVHGGERFTKSVLIDEEVIKAIEELSPLAPLHNPPNLLGIRAAQEVLPKIPHVAVFDTAFLQTIPRHIYLYPVPYEWYERYGVRRYGFHGTSHLYVSRRAAVMLGKSPFEVNLITCHIGNGVSFTAVRKGLAYDHSMGMTPLEGLMMGTRSGDIDPAIIPYMVRRAGLTVEEVEEALNKRSGVLGITGRYTDRRDVLKAAEGGDERSRLAFEMECYRIRKYIGAYLAVLGRVDAVVFTGGVGERGWEMREETLLGMEGLGISLDLGLNRKAVSRNHESSISHPDSPIKVLVIPADEELVMTEDTVAILEGRYDLHTNFRYSFEDPGYRNPLREEAYKREISEGAD